MRPYRDSQSIDEVGLIYWPLVALCEGNSIDTIEGMCVDSRAISLEDFWFLYEVYLVQSQLGGR